MQELKALQACPPIDLSLLSAIKSGQRRPGLLTRLTGWKPPTLTHLNLQILQVHHRFIAILSDNFIELYQLGESAQAATCTLLHDVDCGKKITQSTTNWTANSGSHVRALLVVGTEAGVLQEYAVDEKGRRLVKVAEVAVKEMKAVGFMSDSKLLVMAGNGTLMKYQCVAGSIVRKMTLKVKLQDGVERGETTNAVFLGSLSDQQDQPFYYFFIRKLPTLDQDNSTPLTIQSLFIKQLFRRSDTIQQGQLYLINQVQSPKPLFDTARLIKHKDCFCAIIDCQIEIIRKRFNEYYICDTILRKVDDHMLWMMEEGGVVCSADSKKVEMNRMVVGDLKCELRAMDVVYYGGELPKEYVLRAVKTVVVGQNQKVQTYCMFFSKRKEPGEVRVVLMRKVDAFKKLLELVQKKQPLSVVQDLGEHLGISKKDFYLKLYSLSKRQLPDVNDKLLQTQDVPTIKRQIKFFLRRKKIQLRQLVKVYMRVKSLIHSKLTHNFTPQMFKHYIKAHFLIRKLKIQPDMTLKVTFNQFMQIKKKGLVELLQQCIINEKRCSQQAVNTKEREKSLKQSQKFENTMREALHEFRVVLLDGYEGFLERLLRPFEAVEVVGKFGFLLPMHPYESRFQYSIATRNQMGVKERERGERGEGVDGTMRREPSQKELGTKADLSKSMVLQKEMSRSQGIKRGLSQVEASGMTASNTNPNPLSKSTVQQTATTTASQPKFFYPVKQAQFNMQLSRQRLIQQFSQYNLTSTVQTSIDQLIQNPFFLNKRLISHALMPVSRNQYIEHTNLNSGTRLFLKVCEYANINRPDASTPKKLVQIFREKNNLTGEDLDKVRFYSSLHLFLRQYGVGNGLCMDKLINLSEEDLIALFFLGDEQKHDLILTQLRQLYQPHSPQSLPQPPCSSSPSLSLFDSVLQKFVLSQNCSPVQLRLLIDSLKQLGTEFQQSNQPFIQILIEGFTQRLQVRQQDSITDFVRLFQQIHLSMQLNQKMLRILRIRDLRELFEHFHCEREAVKVVENQSRVVLSRVLENYFVAESQIGSIVLDQQPIGLETPRNMLNILLYLQEKLYPEITQWEVLVIFGERMIDYQAFDILHEIIYEDNVLSLLDVDASEYTQTLIHNALDKLYSQKQIPSFQSVKDYMKSILSLQRQPSPSLQTQLSRFRLCQLITESDFEVTPYIVYNIPDRVQFMSEFIQKGYETLTVERLLEICRCFQMIYGEEDEQQQQQQIMAYLELLAKLLKKGGKVREAVEVIACLIERGGEEGYLGLYPLMTETMMMMVMQLHQGDFATARKYLEAYCFHLYSKVMLLDMFKCSFSAEHAANFQTANQATLHPSLRYLSWRNTTIPLTDIEKITKSLAPTPQFYRYYYFLMTVLCEPLRGFNLTDIKYQYQVLETCLDKVGALLNKHEPKGEVLFGNLNEYEMRRMFLNGLWKEAVGKANQLGKQQFEVTELEFAKALDQDPHFNSVVAALKGLPEQEITRIMIKCQKYLSDTKSKHLFRLKKAQKHQSNLQKNINQVKAQLPSSKPNRQNPSSQPQTTQQQRLNRTMPLGDFLGQLGNISMSYPGLGDRDAVSMVWEVRKQRLGGGGGSQEKQKVAEENQQVLGDVLLEEEQQQGPEKREKMFEMLDASKFYEIEGVPREQLLEVLKFYYEERPLKEIVRVLQATELGSKRNAKLVQSALRVCGPLQIKSLFPFEFFFHITPNLPQQGLTQDHIYYSQIFDHLTPSLKYLITPQNARDLGRMFYISLKFDQAYEHRVYLIALQKLLEQSEPDPNLPSLIDQYLSKMSLKFVVLHHADMLQSCSTGEARNLLTERLLEMMQGRRVEVGGSREEEQAVGRAIEAVRYARDH